MLCLPAHGHGVAIPNSFKRLLRLKAGIWDVPELPGFGGPLIAEGVVQQSQSFAADAMGAKRCWYGVNGATGLLQSALLGVARPGEAVLIPRNAHKSLIQACVIGGLTPVIYEVPFLVDRGHNAPPDEMWLQEVIDSLPMEGLAIAAAVLLHPTYHGYALDIKPLVDQLHEVGLPVLVDEAHGTHLAAEVGEGLPPSALKSGADLIVNSLHKSGLGLSQTAVLWLKGDLVDVTRLEQSIELFQTSSPSSLLLASCESALDEWNTPNGLERLKSAVQQAREISRKLLNHGLPLLETQDPLRLILHTASVGINGFEADKWFLDRGLIAELPEPGCITFCLGFSPQKGVSDLINKHWQDLLAFKKDTTPFHDFVPPPSKRVVVPAVKPLRAFKGPTRIVALSEAVGEVVAELICPYPPGIPLVIPGEKIDQAMGDWLVKQKKMWVGNVPDQLAVLI